MWGGVTLFSSQCLSVIISHLFQPDHTLKLSIYNAGMKVCVLMFCSLWQHQERATWKVHCKNSFRWQKKNRSKTGCLSMFSRYQSSKSDLIHVIQYKTQEFPSSSYSVHWWSSGDLPGFWNGVDWRAGELGTWNFERKFTSHNLSHVRCHVSGVTSHESHVVYHTLLLLFFLIQIWEVSWWSVCYQRGLPHLVFSLWPH